MIEAETFLTFEQQAQAHDMTVEDYREFRRKVEISSGSVGYDLTRANLDSLAHDLWQEKNRDSRVQQ